MAKILIIDEQASIRVSIRENLEEMHTVEEASNGTEGAHKYETIKPSLIITSLNLAGITGLELVRWIRTHSKSSEVKIISISDAFYSEKACNVLLQAGADLCIPKSISQLQIKNFVNNLLNTL